MLKQYLVPALIGLAAGLALMAFIDTFRSVDPCPAIPPCPDCNCPNAVSIQGTRTDLSGVEKLKRVNLDNSVEINGPVTIYYSCEGDTALAYIPQTRSLRAHDLDSLIEANTH